MREAEKKYIWAMPDLSVEALLKKTDDLRLVHWERIIERSKTENGFISKDALDREMKKYAKKENGDYEGFGSTTGGEYFMDHNTVHSRHVGIPVLPNNAEYTVTSRATIFAPRKNKNEVLKVAKEIAEKKGIPVAVSVSGKLVPRIPVQKMYLEMATELHNRLLKEFGDRVRLTAVVGGTGTRNVATVPIKVKADSRGRLKPLVGTFPDMDFFAVIRGVTEEEKERIRKMAREVEKSIAPKYGFSENSYFIDVHRDWGVVDEKDIEGIAHSLHRLKPKIILHGREFYEEIRRNPQFKEREQEEMRRYVEKLGMLSSTLYTQTIANVWRQIKQEKELAEQKLQETPGDKKKEWIARKILAEEMERALQDVIEIYAPLGMNVQQLTEQIEREQVDTAVKETAPKIYRYREFGGKRMYLARKLANNDKETARILAIVESAANIAMERTRQRIKERNNMVEDPRERVLLTHIFRAMKAVQRKMLATAIEDLIRAKEATGRSAIRDGYKYLPEKVYKYPRR